MKRKKRIKISVWQLLAIGYLLVILIGSILLVLPYSTVSGRSAGYLNALFVATSATCVTGLTPVVTGEYFSVFGQIVIILLIQTGGLGFMTFVSTVFMLFKHRMKMYEKRALAVAAGVDRKFDGVTKLVKRIFIGTAIFEILGAALLCIRFVPDFGAKGVYYAFWHSISAFCNAGFDLIGIGGTSLSRYATDPLVTLTLSALIIIGGLGFIVWSDVWDCRGRIKKFQLNTKVVLFMTAVLLVLPTALFLMFEWNNPSYAGYNFGEKLLCSFFNAVSPRTAGFYTTDPSTLSDSGFLLTVILMFVGGSSGSTAGGIKVGTVAVIFMGMAAAFRGRRDINIGKKRIDHSLLAQALAIFAACLGIVLFSTLLMCAIQPDDINVTFQKVLFECVSALGTCGLTLSLTPLLNAFSKVLLIILMYAGRVGILTLALAVGEKRSTSEIRKPLDTMLIG